MATTSSLVKTGALAGAAAAVATTIVAAVAKVAGVSLEVDAVPIPIGAFTWWTVVGAALGIGLARLLGTRRRFLTATSIGFTLSLIPPIAFPDDVATKAVFVAAHALAAAIVIPALSRLLAPSDASTSPIGVQN